VAIKVRQVWKDNILRLMRCGNHLTYAAKICEVSGRVLHQELNNDSEFAKQVESIQHDQLDELTAKLLERI
jgi:hypothetical protein